MLLISALRLCLSMFPAPVQAFVLGLLAIFAVVVVFKIVAFVLDSIPFL